MGLPDTAEPGEQRGLTLSLQPDRKPPGHSQAGPWLSQASREAHAGHSRRAGTRVGVTHRLHALEAARSGSTLSWNESFPVQRAPASAKCGPRTLE